MSSSGPSLLRALPRLVSRPLRCRLPPGGGFEEKARQIVKTARRADRALRSAGVARNRAVAPVARAKAAKEQADRMRDEFRDAVRQLLEELSS